MPPWLLEIRLPTSTAAAVQTEAGLSRCAAAGRGGGRRAGQQAAGSDSEEERRQRKRKQRRSLSASLDAEAAAPRAPDAAPAAEVQREVLSVAARSIVFCAGRLLTSVQRTTAVPLSCWTVCGVPDVVLDTECCPDWGPQAAALAEDGEAVGGLMAEVSGAAATSTGPRSLCSSATWSPLLSHTAVASLHSFRIYRCGCSVNPCTRQPTCSSHQTRAQQDWQAGAGQQELSRRQHCTAARCMQ